MTYTIEDGSDATTITLGHPLTTDDINQIRAEVWDRITKDGVREISFAMGAVESLDPTTISLLAGAKNMMNKEDGRIVLLGLTEEASALIHQLNLQDYFQLTDEYNHSSS